MGPDPGRFPPRNSPAAKRRLLPGITREQCQDHGWPMGPWERYIKRVQSVCKLSARGTILAEVWEVQLCIILQPKLSEKALARAQEDVQLVSRSCRLFCQYH